MADWQLKWQWKDMYCTDWSDGKCRLGPYCKFLHGPADKRKFPLGYDYCAYFLEDRCHFGEKCERKHDKGVLKLINWVNPDPSPRSSPPPSPPVESYSPPTVKKEKNKIIYDDMFQVNRKEINEAKAILEVLIMKQKKSAILREYLMNFIDSIKDKIVQDEMDDRKTICLNARKFAETILDLLLKKSATVELMSVKLKKLKELVGQNSPLYHELKLISVLSNCGAHNGPEPSYGETIHIIQLCNRLCDLYLENL